jgi:GNAT superfamily N-acetyltransferase
VGGAAPAEVDATGEAPTEALLGEPRWPPVTAVVLFMALTIALRLWLPHDAAAGTSWLVPALEGVLLVVLVTSNPSGPAERRRMHRVLLALVGLLVAAALWATALLVDDLIRGRGVANSSSELLASGSVVWLGNNLAFALLYWLMDGGGPLARTRRTIPVDFAFTQHINPEMAPPGWRPVFLDYLHLGFTNATAFSPTDVMPLTHRAKYTMLVQATVALALFALVVARAVNAFT